MSKFKAEELLPSRFQSIQEFWDFCVANDPEFDSAEEQITSGINNKFPQSADINGVRAWEEILNIIPNTSDTLEDRRFRIITKLQSRTPYNWSTLHQMLETICGKDGYECVRKAPFVLGVALPIDSASKLNSVMTLLEEVVPMHIFLDVYCRAESVAMIDFACYGLGTCIVETPIKENIAQVYMGSPYLESATIETKLTGES